MLKGPKGRHGAHQPLPLPVSWSWRRTICERISMCVRVVRAIRSRRAVGFRHVSRHRKPFGVPRFSISSALGWLLARGLGWRVGIATERVARPRSSQQNRANPSRQNNAQQRPSGRIRRRAEKNDCSSILLLARVAPPLQICLPGAAGVDGDCACHAPQCCLPHAHESSFRFGVRCSPNRLEPPSRFADIPEPHTLNTRHRVAFAARHRHPELQSWPPRPRQPPWAAGSSPCSPPPTPSRGQHPARSRCPWAPPHRVSWRWLALVPRFGRTAPATD